MVNDLPALPADSAEPPRTSGLAIASLVLGVLSCPFNFLASIPGLICGIIGLRSIKRSEQGGAGPRLTGRGLAITGITLSAIATLLWPLIVLLLVSGLDAARNAALVFLPSNNLKQIVFATQRVQDSTGFFPGDIIDRDARPLLSWRVAILPHLGDEAAALYREFHLDEPWDSDHNKPLLARMPAVFATPGEPPQKGLTDVVHPIGEGTAFSEVDGAKSLDEAETAGLSGVRPETIRDGLSNTVLVAFLPGLQTPWTQPGDFNGDPADVFATLKAAGLRVVVVGMGDGSVRPIRTDLDPRTIRALFSRNGGETLPEDAF